MKHPMLTARSQRSKPESYLCKDGSSIVFLTSKKKKFHLIFLTGEANDDLMSESKFS